MIKYRTHPRYRLLVILSLVMVLLMGWSLFRFQDAGSLLFLAIALGLGVWYGRAMLSSVELWPESVILNRPLTGTCKVAFRQLLDVQEEGRTGRSILLLYYPLESNGLLDLERVSTLALPAVADQAHLLDSLLKHVST